LVTAKATALALAHFKRFQSKKLLLTMHLAAVQRSVDILSSLNQSCIFVRHAWKCSLLYSLKKMMGSGRKMSTVHTPLATWTNESPLSPMMHFHAPNTPLNKPPNIRAAMAISKDLFNEVGEEE